MSRGEGCDPSDLAVSFTDAPPLLAGLGIRLPALMRFVALPAVLASALVSSPGGASPPGVVHVKNELRHGGSKSLFNTGMRLERDLEIGRDEGENDPILAQVGDVVVDARGNVYVAEMAQDMVVVYDNKGSFVSQIGRRGEGPGEFMRPQALTLSVNHELMVADQQSVSVFDSTRTFVSRFNHNLRDAPLRGMVATGKNYIFVGCFAMFEQQTIHMFSKDGQMLRSFCDSYAVGTGEDFRIEQMFAGGPMDVDPEGNICYSQMYPYEIRKFSPNGKLLMVVDRENEFMGKPDVIIDGDRMTVRMPTGSYGFCVLSDGTLVNSILVTEERKNEGFPWSFIDVFAPDGKLKGSIAIEPANLLLGRDSSDRLYFLEYGQPTLLVRYVLKQ